VLTEKFLDLHKPISGVKVSGINGITIKWDSRLRGEKVYGNEMPMERR
jgi:hypothetical protein